MRKLVKHVAAGSIAVAVLTFLCFQAHIDFAAALSLYLLLVVLHSLTGDFPASAMVSTLSAGCLDFFFTEPRFSFQITNPLNTLALFAFVFTALVITRLVSRVREEATSARFQKERLDRLYQLSQQLLGLAPELFMEKQFLEPFHRLFGITAICIFNTTELRTAGDSPGKLADKTREAYIGGRDLNDAGSRQSVRCIRAGGRMTVAIGFEGLHDPTETAGALSTLTAGLLDRTNAFHEASAAAAAVQTEVYRSAVLDALAHEFKTPLATISAAAGGLREAGPLGKEQLELADIVENEAERLGSLTSRLLRTARLDREEIKPQLEVVDVVALAANIAAQYAARSSDRRILGIGDRDPVEVLADPELLRVTVSQLIENACKYSEPGSTVRIEIERQTALVAVRVSNNGSSIPYNERQRIFERFYRGADARRSTSGSGLGLYVARKIALAHGGALDLETGERANAGVTFCLKIPGAKDECEHAVTAR